MLLGIHPWFGNSSSAWGGGSTARCHGCLTPAGCLSTSPAGSRGWKSLHQPCHPTFQEGFSKKQHNNCQASFNPTTIALGSSAIGSAEGSTKVSPWFHQGFTEVVSRRFHICLSNGCCFRKGSFGGFRQLFFTFVSQSHSGVKVAWVVDMSHPIHLQSAVKRPIISWLLWVFFGFIILFSGRFTCNRNRPLPNLWWYEAGGFDVINRAVMWYPLDAAVVEPGVRALQEMCDLGPLVRPIALKADPKTVGWLGDSWRKYLIFAWEWIGWMGW